MAPPTPPSSSSETPEKSSAPAGAGSLRSRTSGPAELRNIAILAHVDAGKTTVSERLLYLGEMIPSMGEVEEGLATMDYLEEEKKRGITIEAGIASYEWKGAKVTFVDTPGHVDFGVEVDFALRAVEGVVLVLSGVSGIESQSLEAWEKIQSNRNSVLIFVNKLDLPTSDHRKVLEQVKLLFRVNPVILTLPLFSEGSIEGVIDVMNGVSIYRAQGNVRKLVKGPIPEGMREEYEAARKGLLDAASEFRDEIAEAFLNGVEPEADILQDGLRLAVLSGRHVPLYLGSALKSIGIRQLMNGIRGLLPPPAPAAGPGGAKALVIKIRHYQGIGQIRLLKAFAPFSLGEAKLWGGEEARLYRVFAETLEEIDAVAAGEIAAIKADRGWNIGEHLGGGSGERFRGREYRPILQARIELQHEEDFDHVSKALKLVAEAEPSISIEPDMQAGGWQVNTVGELQLDVLCRKLEQDFGCRIRSGAPRVRYLERLRRPSGPIVHKTVIHNITVEIAMEAASGPEGQLENEIRFPAETIGENIRKVLQSAFWNFCEQGVLGQGAMAGLKVEIRHFRLEGAGGLEGASFKSLKDALELNLGPEKFEVLEPLMNLQVIVPDEFCGAVLADLAAKGASVRKLDSDGHNSIILLEIPLEKTFGYATLLRSLSKGLGVFVLTYGKHAPRKR